MAEVPTPPKPPTPKAAAKGLAGVFKGKPAWVWIAGVTVLIGVAYLAMKGNQKDDSESPADDAEGYAEDQMAVGDYGGYYPVASEGAYGGNDQPYDIGAPLISDNAGTPEPSPVTNNITVLAPPTAKVTGGGKPAATGAKTHAPPKAKAKEKTWGGHPLSWWRNPSINKKHGKWRWPGGGGFVHSRAFQGR